MQTCIAKKCNHVVNVIFYRWILFVHAIFVFPDAYIIYISLKCVDIITIYTQYMYYCFDLYRNLHTIQRGTLRVILSEHLTRTYQILHLIQIYVIVIVVNLYFNSTLNRPLLFHYMILALETYPERGKSCKCFLILVISYLGAIYTGPPLKLVIFRQPSGVQNSDTPCSRISKVEFQ